MITVTPIDSTSVSSPSDFSRAAMSRPLQPTLIAEILSIGAIQKNRDQRIAAGENRWVTHPLKFPLSFVSFFPTKMPGV